MPSAEKQVRVFISSTFRDMHAERDHLVTVVFPELRERVEQLGLEFFDVDLRWGVPAKDLNGETANSWEYCRQWIDRVEPFFVCILGQRYGWVPEPRHFRDNADRQRQEREPRSITDLEVRHAVLDTRRKRRSYFYLRATPVPEPNAEYVDPPECQGRLEELKTTVRQCGRPVRNYSPEWTGQGFMGLKEFGDFVLDDLWSGVLRDERYVSKEVWRQVLNKDPDFDPRYTDESQPVPRELWEKIVALAKPPPQDPLDAERQKMEAFAASRLRWFQGRTHELQQLTDSIRTTAENASRLAVVAAAPGQGKSALMAKLWQEITQATLTRPDGHPLPSEGRGAGGEGHFVIAHFVGATERSATAHALVQRLLDELDRSGIEWPADEVREGEEPKRDFNSLCSRLKQRLGDYAGDRHIVILLDALNQLTDGHNLVWLPNRLGRSVRIVVSCVNDSAGGPSSVVAESGTAADARDRVPPEQQVLHALTSRQPGPLCVPLEPLTEADVRTIVVEYLKEYCKELDREQVDAICRMDQAKNPLYLLVILGELRTLGGNDMNRIVGERIAALAHDYPDTKALFRWVLQRLEVFGPEAVRWWCLYLAYGRFGMASQELADLLARKLGEKTVTTALLVERGLRRYLLRRGGQLDFFHGQLRQAVMEQYGSQAELTVVHREMAEYFTACAKGTDPQKEWETDSVRGFSECVFHFTKAGQHDQAAGLLTNFPFLLHKTRAGLLEGVFEDYDMVRGEAPTEVKKRLEIWTGFFHEKAHILRRGNDEWPAHKILLQLAVEHADDSPLTIGAERWLLDNRCDWLWLRRVPRLPNVQKNPYLAVFEGHRGCVYGALELRNGRLLSWSADELRLWDARSSKCIAVLIGHSWPIEGALALADGRILSWSQDCSLRLWDGYSGQCLAVLEGHVMSVSGALALTNGRILSWSEDCTLHLWDGHSSQNRVVFKGRARLVRALLVRLTDVFLSWISRKTLRLWSGHSGQCLAVLKGHSKAISGALALTDGRILSWSKDKTLRLWDAQWKMPFWSRVLFSWGLDILPHSGQCLAVLKGHTSPIIGALMLADGKILSWSGDWTLRLRDRRPWSGDCALRLWDGHSGRCLAVLKGHSDMIRGALTLGDGRILSWSLDKTLRLWDGNSGDCLAVLEAHSHSIRGALALAGDKIVSWSDDYTLRLWDGFSGQCRTVLKEYSDPVSGVLALNGNRILSWSGSNLLSGDSTLNTLRLWDANDGRCLASLAGHHNLVIGALALADGRVLSWSNDNTLRLWDTQTDQGSSALEGHSETVRGMLAYTNGRILSWSNDHTLRLWDTLSGQCTAVLKGHSSPIQGALALADGKIMSWSGDRALRLWDGRSGQCLAVLEGHSSCVEGALVLTDGRILSWSLDKTLRLWDAQSGHGLGVLEGHSDFVKGALALPEGRILSWSWGKTLRLWDTHNYQSTAIPHRVTNPFATRPRPDGKSCKCLAVFEGHSDSVRGALALVDGRILSWSSDKTLRLWDAHNGRCLGVLKGHSLPVRSALALADGRILSWTSDDSRVFIWPRYKNSLRLWDADSGRCLAVFKGYAGHAHAIKGALALADGRILSWSDDETSWLWDERSGQRLEVLPKNQASRLHPEWLHAREMAQNSERVRGNYFADSSRSSARLRHKSIANILAAWNADSYASSHILLSDGTAVFTQRNGQVCILKLHQGQRRISLAEAEAILAERGELSAISDRPSAP